jgi:toxin FitB
LSREVFVLDTNVIAELRRRRPHGAVVKWLLDIPHQQILLSAATIGEIQSGIEATRENDARKAAEIEGWLDEQVSIFNVIPMNGEIFRTWAKLMHRTSDDHMIDAMIAATALVLGATVATRNARDFRQFGVVIVNPFT